jgi:serine/threonine protein kinase
MFRRRFSILLLLLLASLRSARNLDSKLSQYGDYSRPIAKGYTADVLLFSRTLDNSTFAIKRFFGNTIQGYDGEYDESIRAEYAISSALHHEHIISTYDLIYEGHIWHIVMDYCPAVLSAKIARARVVTPMLPREVNCVFKQLLEAVEYMHGQGIAHQDLKPNNIGLDRLGRVKLLDFGQSYRYQDQLSKQLTLQWGRLTPSILIHI